MICIAASATTAYVHRAIRFSCGCFDHTTSSAMSASDITASAVVALAAMQVVLGAVLAFVALAPPFQVLHLTVASLLMGAQMVQLLVAWWE